MAPELIRGDKNIIPIKCDVYSYGMLLDNLFEKYLIL